MNINIQVVLDRFEGDYAILLLGTGSKAVKWPREYLPSDSAEGQILSFSLEPDKAATELARREAEELLRELVAENKKTI